MDATIAAIQLGRITVNTITICPMCQQICNSRRHDCERERVLRPGADRCGDDLSLTLSLSDWMIIIDALARLGTIFRRPLQPAAPPRTAASP